MENQWVVGHNQRRSVKLVRLSKHKSQYENCQTLVQTLHDRFVPRMHYLRQSAKNFSFYAFIAMGSISQPPVQKFNKQKIEETFFGGIIHALFALKLVMMRRIASKQRDATLWWKVTSWTHCRYRKGFSDGEHKRRRPKHASLPLVWRPRSRHT